MPTRRSGRIVRPRRSTTCCRRQNRPLRPAGQFNQSRDRLERHDRRALPERHARARSTSSTARRCARRSRRASSRTSRGSASCRTASSCSRITATACGIATSRSGGSPADTPTGTQSRRRARASRSSPNESGAARRRHDRRQAVHVVHLARHAEEAGALSDPDVERHARDARLPARSAAARALRSSASRRPLVQPRRRQRPRLLEQLRTTSPPTARRRWAPSVTSGSSRPRAAPIAASWRSRWTGCSPTACALLRETTRFIFRGAGDARSIDRITTLTALDQPRRLPRQQGRHRSACA